MLCGLRMQSIGGEGRGNERLDGGGMNYAAQRQVWIAGTLNRNPAYSNIFVTG